MTLSDKRFISDEQLSAYLDNAVTAQERQSIEAAIAQDADVAWRLESLRHTVSLLQALPEVPLPRSFALTLDHLQQDRPHVAAPVAEPAPQPEPAAPVRTPRPAESAPGLWEQFLSGWQEFWGAGNLTLRNAAAVSLALLVVLLAGSSLTDVGGTRTGTLATAPMSAPAAAPDVIALAEPAQSDMAVQEDSAPAAAKLPVEESSPADAATESTAASPAPEAAALAMAEEEPAPAQENAPDAAAAMLAPEIGAAPPVGPMSDPASPGILMPPGGMGMGGGGDMGSGGDMQGGAGGSSERLLPPEVYAASPDDVLVIEPTPLPPAQESAPSADATAETQPDAQAEPTDDEATPAAVALVQPPPTEPAATARSAATETVETAMVETTAVQPAASAQSYGLSLLNIAQAGGALLTLMLATLWWRSRRSTPRE